MKHFFRENFPFEVAFGMRYTFSKMCEQKDSLRCTCQSGLQLLLIITQFKECQKTTACLRYESQLGETKKKQCENNAWS